MPIKKKIEKESKEKPSEKLDRTKLHSTISKPEMPEEGSLRAIIILIVVIVFVAVGGAFFIKSLQNRVVEDEPSQQTPTEITTMSREEDSEQNRVADQIIMKEVASDSDAQDLLEIEQFSQEDQTLENENASLYTLASLLAQPYESFYRIIFTFSSEQALDTAPRTDVNYRNIVSEIEFTFTNVEEDQTGLIKGQALSISDSVVTNIVRSGKSDERNLIYQVKMSQSALYAVQTKGNQIILDILEPDEEFELEVEDPADDDAEENLTTTPEAAQTTPKPVSSTGKSIVSDIEGNSAGIKGFTYSDSIERFKYQLILSNENIPNVTSSVGTNGTEVSVVVKNLAFDGVASDSVVSKADFQASGVRNVLSMQSSFANNSSTYVFKLEKQADYELKEVVVDGGRRLSIEFIH